jgi:hypothetical protein
MRLLLLAPLLACSLGIAPSRAEAAFQGLGELPGGDYFVSQALGVSGDGSVVVGSGSFGKCSSPRAPT